MNKLIPKIGAGIVTTAVFLFAVCLITDFGFGSYLVCMFLPIGYIMTAAGFHHESDNEHMTAANVGLIFSAVYSVLIFLVYFAQTTSVRLDDMNEQALKILDFKRGGSIFNYDMPHLEDFPRHGLLQFYIGDDDICGLDSPCKVIYIPEYKKEASVLLTENPFEDDYTGKTPFGVEGKMKFKLASRFICSNCKEFEDKFEDTVSDKEYDALYKLCNADGCLVGG